ncbi:hypothetical protein [Sediminibacillus massiliensis]|uniref:hypothetical protein n=1 Tax=Sediminibacillus massiliensis TaxID=1926277 RepID=UPI0009885AF0|nr:hypothetical protein [Sediminibacillus massiliensis]
MVYAFITLLIISIVLFLMSFFMNDRFKNIENQLEQFSITSMQESYQLKKKIKILEEELLTEDLTDGFPSSTTSQIPPMYQRIHSLYAQGSDVSEISRKTSLKENDVHAIISQLTQNKGQS